MLNVVARKQTQKFKNQEIFWKYLLGILGE